MLDAMVFDAPRKKKGKEALLDMVSVPSAPAPKRKARAAADRKMIVVEVRFWTEDLPSKGKRTPKHAWTAGKVTIGANRLHGIKAGSNVPFGSILQIPAAIEKALLKAGITLHPNPTMRKYVKG